MKMTMTTTEERKKEIELQLYLSIPFFIIGILCRDLSLFTIVIGFISLYKIIEYICIVNEIPKNISCSFCSKNILHTGSVRPSSL